ncbi:cadherin-18-like [Engraulis encrasicolus]|uniref:cadherin-18-like n=1 Tax=Engraulis encrasicolus TaxID=184585 RepID=UPI002FD2AE28
MRVLLPSACLCPVLLCLCLLERCCGNGHHLITRLSQHQNHSRGGNDTEVHHRPKRGWIWNQFFVLEEHIGPDAQYVGKLHSNSDKGDGSVRYILSGEGAGTIFIIDETTGDIHATKSLDRERKAHYVLHAQAIDRHTLKPLEPESEFIIKVQDINDNAPKFPDGPFRTSVAEMSEVGTSVFQVTATDADDPTYGNSARVVYSILQGQPYFSVDPMTGIIRTALANMDREAREHYAVVIQAKDMAGQVGGLSGSTTINITLTDVNDNPPKFPKESLQLFVPESAEVGKPVGKIAAHDADLGPNAETKYTILNTEAQAVFTIATGSDGREGIISLKKPLNFEKKTMYTLKIEGANTHLDPRFSYLGPYKDTTQLKITVGDVDEPPVFLMDYYIMDVFENAPIGTPVGTVTARDPDRKSSRVRYFMEPSLNEDDGFIIEPETGLIRTTYMLDREETPLHNITVSAAEIDNPSMVSHVPVTVQVLDRNDNPPEIKSDEDIIVCENTRPGQVIQTVSAVDKDDFANGQRFSFSLPVGIPINPNFTLKDNDDSTASIIGRRRRFNRLSQELYTLPIVVWDNGEPMLSGTSTLTLRVCPCQRGTRAKVCQSEAFLSSAGLSTGALIAILLCVLILLAIVILFITLRRSKKEPLIISEEDIRENVVTYDDEGGGEEDTEAFDISALRNPSAAEDLKFRRDIRPDGSRPPLGASLCVGPGSAPIPGPSHNHTHAHNSHQSQHVPHTPRRLLQGRGGGSGSTVSLDTEAELDIREFIGQRLAEADRDTSGPPYDSLQTYAFEGQGSPTGSISPLGSNGTQSELDYTFLDDWGPEFRKLAELYGEEVEKETVMVETKKETVPEAETEEGTEAETETEKP